VNPLRSLRHLLLAVQFFTRIPVTGRLADWVGYSPAMLRASAAHFPAIGWIIGGPVALCYVALCRGLPAQSAAPWVAAVFSTLLGVMLTGAFHEDGLADVADGLGGSLNRERALDIMKDSRVGAYGALALVLALLCKVALLALLGQVSPVLAGLALLVAHVSSRTVPLFIIRTLPHVGDTAQSKSKPLADQVSGAALAVALLWWLPVLALALAPLWLGPPQTLLHALVTVTPGAAATASAAALAWPANWLPAWLFALLTLLLALVWMGRLFAQRLQGFTGDCLGATQQVCEIAFYLGLALAWRG